jgi:hypothetical protein
MTSEELPKEEHYLNLTQMSPFTRHILIPTSLLY